MKDKYAILRTISKLKTMAEVVDDTSLPIMRYLIDCKTIAQLLADLEKAMNELRFSLKYLVSINDCKKYCDLSTNSHTPECSMEQSFRQTLKELNENT